MNEIHKDLIEITYDSTANIYRSEKNKTNGETIFANVIKYQNIACAISKKALPNNNESDSYNKINYTVTLFISPEIEILQGDIIEVTHIQKTYKYVAGEPFVYVTHQEVSLEKEGKA